MLVLALCLVGYVMITDNISSPASDSAFCAVQSAIEHVTDAADSAAAGGCHDVAMETPSTHPALYVFVVAQLLVGVGGCGVIVLTCPYIDENAPHAKSALYIGKQCSHFSRVVLLLVFTAALR